MGNLKSITIQCENYWLKDGSLIVGTIPLGEVSINRTEHTYTVKDFPLKDATVTSYSPEKLWQSPSNTPLKDMSISFVVDLYSGQSGDQIPCRIYDVIVKHGDCAISSRLAHNLFEGSVVENLSADDKVVYTPYVDRTSPAHIVSEINAFCTLEDYWTDNYNYPPAMRGIDFRNSDHAIGKDSGIPLYDFVDDLAYSDKFTDAQKRQVALHLTHPDLFKDNGKLIDEEGEEEFIRMILHDFVEGVKFAQEIWYFEKGKERYPAG